MPRIRGDHHEAFGFQGGPLAIGGYELEGDQFPMSSSSNASSGTDSNGGGYLDKLTILDFESPIVQRKTMLQEPVEDMMHLDSNYTNLLGRGHFSYSLSLSLLSTNY